MKVLLVVLLFFVPFKFANAQSPTIKQFDCKSLDSSLRINIRLNNCVGPNRPAICDPYAGILTVTTPTHSQLMAVRISEATYGSVTRYGRTLRYEISSGDMVLTRAEGYWDYWLERMTEFSGVYFGQVNTQLQCW